MWVWIVEPQLRSQLRLTAWFSLVRKTLKQALLSYAWTPDLQNIVQLLSCVWLFVTPWTTACQTSLSTISQSLLRLVSVELVMPSKHLILCHPHLLPSIFPSIRVFSNESALHIQIRSVAQSCPTLCNPMNRSTPGLPVYHQLPEFTEIHVHWVSDAI